jgi:5-methylcytosine-specific restriction protein A
LREIANTLRQSISTANQINETPIEYDVFVEGLIITESHSRRERDPNLRRKLLASRASRGALRCDLCDQDSSHIRPEIADSIFESHHLVPLSQSGLVKTKLSDLALLCACCHRAVHRMIAINKNWISIEEAREMLLVKA